MSEPRVADAGASAQFGRRATRFVVMLGILSFFADFTYEGARSIVGPFLGSLGASGVVVASVSGFGELLGYGLRLISGRAADRTQRFWPIAIAGYIVQMASVPALALAGSWPVAAGLVVTERIGKATRNPPRDAMLSRAAERIGYGWAFGLHEALDQSGALIGPLAVAGVLALRGDYRLAFASLAVTAAINLTLVGVARRVYPHPETLGKDALEAGADRGYPRRFWIYLAGAGLVAAGFADYPLIAFHFARDHAVPAILIPVFYSVAMAVSGGGSLVLGRLFDRHGFRVLIAVTLISAAFAPLVFFGGLWGALLGVALWGLGMGVHESMIPAAVGPMVDARRRASAYGLFTAGYGVCWFAGSVVMGMIYDRSVTGTVIFCIIAELAAIPFLVVAGRRVRLTEDSRERD